MSALPTNAAATLSIPATQSENESIGPPPQTYWQIFVRFLRFGLLAWGGPVAQIAMPRRELVEEQRWISRARFNRVLAVYQVLRCGGAPAPECTARRQPACSCGGDRAGRCTGIGCG
jgi:hypothetical protein